MCVDQRRQQKYMIEKTLSALGFESSEAKVYLTLLKSGSMTVGNLAKRMGIPRTTLYGFLSRLSDRGLTSQSLRKGIKVYSAESPDKILLLFQQKQAQLDGAQKDFQGLLPKLKEQRRAVLSAPRFQMYEGEEGLKNVLKDMLLYSDIESCAFWPIKQMMAILSPDFFQYHNTERIRRNIHTRAIWPVSEAVDIKNFQFLGSAEPFRREIRIAPPNLSFSMGYWFYANKVAFLASRKEGFGFIIESEELVETLKAQFEVVWNISKPVSSKPEDVKDFLATLKN